MTVRVWLVRHGEPARVDHLDPGLTGLGHRQAAELVDRWPERSQATVALRTSPLRRARETMAPLAAAWDRSPIVDLAMRELPSPDRDGDSRRAWLQSALTGTFADLGAEQRSWREAVVAAIGALSVDTIVTTHAVVVNAVLGHCSGDDRVLSWVPAHTSITEFQLDAPGHIKLVERGPGKAYGVVT